MILIENLITPLYHAYQSAIGGVGRVTGLLFVFFCNINIFLIQTYVLTFTQYKKLYSDLPARGS